MLSVVIPAYNEENRIGNTLSCLGIWFDSAEIIVVHDGKDNTPEVVKKFNGVKLLKSPNRLGKGLAIKIGIENSSVDRILLIDADLPTTRDDLEKVLSVDADLVITKRRFVNISSERYILHKGFIFLVRLLFPSLRKISDFQSGVKVVKRSKVISVADELISNDLLFDVNIIYAFKRRGYTIKEVEIQYLNDEDGSKIGKSLSKTIVLMALSLLRLRIFYSPFKKLLYYPLMVRFQRWVFNRLNS